jgi:hypothetical protein
MSQVCILPEPAGGELPIRGVEDQIFCQQNEGTVVEQVEVHGEKTHIGCAVTSPGVHVSAAVPLLIVALLGARALLRRLRKPHVRSV